MNTYQLPAVRARHSVICRLCGLEMRARPHEDAIPFDGRVRAVLERACKVLVQV